MNIRFQQTYDYKQTLQKRPLLIICAAMEKGLPPIALLASLYEIIKFQISYERNNSQHPILNHFERNQSDIDTNAPGQNLRARIWNCQEKIFQRLSAIHLLSTIP